MTPAELQPGLGVSLPRRPGPAVEVRVQVGPETSSGPAPGPLRPSCLPKGRGTGEAARFREPESLSYRHGHPRVPCPSTPGPSSPLPGSADQPQRPTPCEKRATKAPERECGTRNDVTSADVTRSLLRQQWDAGAALDLEHLSY